MRSLAQVCLALLLAASGLACKGKKGGDHQCSPEPECPVAMHPDPATCLCVCDDVCTVGALACGSDTANVEFCKLGADACPAWDVIACPNGEVCDPAKAAAGTSPACSCPPVACTVGEHRCDAAGNAQNCVAGGSCGTQWVTTTCDQTLQHCADTGPATCECNALASGCGNGHLGDDYCVTPTGAQFQTCAKDDATGCFFMTPTQPLTCPSAQQTCEVSGPGSRGSCTCPAVSACTLGTTTCSDGTHLSACVLDAPGGCPTLRVTNCGDFSSTCDPAGRAHCVCPVVNSGTTLYADAVNGDDTYGTGASAPGSCAFKSISKAIQMAPSIVSVNTIAARPGTYDTTAGETFPLRLASGMTLTTDATPGNTRQYVIDGRGGTSPGAFSPFASSVFTSVFYSGTGGGSSAALRNFTLKDSAPGGGPNYRIVCNGTGTLTLDNVTVDAAGTSYGVAFYEGCAGTVTGLNVSNGSDYGVALRVATTAGTVALSSSSLSNNANIGLEVDDGDLTLTDVTIAGNHTSGALFNPQAVVGSMSTRPPSVTATNLHIHHTTNGVGLAFDGGTYGAIQLEDSQVYSNGGDGILIFAGSPTFSNVSVHDNVGDGIWLWTNYSGVTTISGGNVSANYEGIYAGNGTLTIDGAPTTVSANRAFGIHIAQTASPATINGVTVSNHTMSPGLFVDGGTATITNCDVFGNGTWPAGGSYSAGVLLDVGTTVTFTGNKVHSNNGHGVINAGTHSLGPAACGPDSNQFYCYGPGRYAIYNMGAGVTADYDYWASAAPSTPGFDFTNGVTVNQVCNPPITTCP